MISAGGRRPQALAALTRLAPLCPPAIYFYFNPVR